jgi:hypothetical protein
MQNLDKPINKRWENEDMIENIFIFTYEKLRKLFNSLFFSTI